AQLALQWKGVALDATHIEALAKWEQRGVPWLDELYDLTALFEQRQGFRVEQIIVEPKAAPASAAKKKAEEKYVGQIVSKGKFRAADERAVLALKDALNRDGHRRAKLDLKGEEFTLHADITKQPAERYVLRVTVPPRGRQAVAEPIENPVENE